MDSIALSPGNDGNLSSGRWTPQEYKQFVQFYEVYGKDWKAISSQIKTRTPEQVRSHAQKYLAKKLRIQKEQQEVKEAQELIPDYLEKRLTRKKTKRINYKERDAYPEALLLEFERKKMVKKEKEEEKNSKEVERKQKINVGFQTAFTPEETNMPTIPSFPFFMNYINPWIYGNNGIWIP